MTMVDSTPGGFLTGSLTSKRNRSVTNNNLGSNNNGMNSSEDGDSRVSSPMAIKHIKVSVDKGMGLEEIAEMVKAATDKVLKDLFDSDNDINSNSTGSGNNNTKSTSSAFRKHFTLPSPRKRRTYEAGAATTDSHVPTKKFDHGSTSDGGTAGGEKKKKM